MGSTANWKKSILTVFKPITILVEFWGEKNLNAWDIIAI